MNKKLFFNLISLIAITLLVVIFVIPFWNSINFSRKEIKNDKLEIDTIEDLLAKTEWLEQEYEQVKKDSEKVFLALPKEKDIPNLIVQFGDLAAINGLVLESMQFGELEGEKDKKSVSAEEIFVSETETSSKLAFRSLPVTIMVSGSYANFKKYISSLEYNIRSMNVSYIGFSEEHSRESTAGTFNFNLKLSVYYQ